MCCREGTGIGYTQERADRYTVFVGFGHSKIHQGIPKRVLWSKENDSNVDPGVTNPSSYQGGGFRNTPLINQGLNSSWST